MKDEDARARNSSVAQNLSEEDYLILVEIETCSEDLVRAIERIARFAVPRPNDLVSARESVLHGVSKAREFLLREK